MKEQHFNKLRKHSKENKKSREDFFDNVHDLMGKNLLDQEQIEQEKTFLRQMIFKIKSIFGNPQKNHQKDESKLIGRIQELNKSAADVLKVLNTVREDLKKEVDGEFYPFVEAVMNPMIRDISRIEKIVKKEVLVARKLDAFNQYDQWIDRAKMWVQVCSTSKSKDMISEAIIRHTLEDFTALIDRDLRLIQDYQEHLLNELEALEEHKKQIRESIQKGLKPYYKSLNALKQYPETLSLENLNQWKEDVDKRRDRYFNAILQVIDAKIDDLSPSKADTDNFEQMTYLEMEIPLLIEKIEQNPDEECEMTARQLLALEEEVDLLYHDISMPQHIIDRLYALKKLIAKSLKH